MDSGTEPSKRSPTFGEQLKAALANPDVRGSHLVYGRTPAIYRMLGFPDLPLMLPPAVLLKLSTGKDGAREPMSAAEIRQVFEDLEEPVAIFEDLKDDRLIALTTMVDKSADENPVIVALQPNALVRHERANIVLTAYGRENPSPWLDRMSQMLIYRGQRKTPKLSLAALDQCQADEGSDGGTGRKILLPEDLRKYKDALWTQKAQQ